MRRLLLLRHAKAERQHHGGRDHDRPLAERGREEAPLIGSYLARHGYTPDQVIVSTSARTRETWALVSPSLKPRPKVEFEQRVYEAEADTLLAVVKETPTSVHTLLMVGHNPGMQNLAGLLVASGDIDARQRLAEAFPTSGLAIIDFPLDRWDKLHAQAGRLEHFVTGRAIGERSD